MFFVLIITLYTTRVILRVLGVEDYGIYNVVAGFVSLFGFLNTTLSSSMQRFYNYKLGAKGREGIAKVYITGFFAHIILAFVVLVLLESFGVWYVNNVMVIPDERLLAANVLFQVVSISMVLVILQIPYVGIIVAFERMDFFAFVGVLDIILKLLIVLVMPLFPGDKLIVYSLLYLIVSVLNIVLYCSYAKCQLIKDVRLRVNSIDNHLLKEMVSFSGWNLLGTSAYMLRGQGVNMTLNYFFGPVVNAARGVAFQVNSGIMGFSRNIVSAFSPQLTSSYACGNKDRSIRLMFLESKICFALIAMLMIPISYEIDYILNLWLEGNVPESTGVFTILVLIDSLICVLNTPCTQIVFASGELKYYQIGSSLVNILLIPASCLVLLSGANPESVFILTIVFSIINQTICIVLANRIVGFGLANYLKKVIIPCLILAVILPVFPYIICSLVVDSFFRMTFLCITSLIVTSLYVFWVVFDKNGRQSIILLLKQKTLHAPS